jgi:hypothetical protein
MKKYQCYTHKKTPQFSGVFLSGAAPVQTIDYLTKVLVLQKIIGVFSVPFGRKNTFVLQNAKVMRGG